MSAYRGPSRRSGCRDCEDRLPPMVLVTRLALLMVAVSGLFLVGETFEVWHGFSASLLALIGTWGLE